MNALGDSMHSLGYVLDVRHFGTRASHLSGEERTRYIHRVAKHILNYRAKKMGGQIDWKDPEAERLRKETEERLVRVARGEPMDPLSERRE